jgi:excisionase family DNA binding protein
MTVIRWIKEGKIPAFKTAGGHRRILRQDLDRFCRSRGIPFLEGESAAGKVLVVDADAGVRDAVVEAARAVDESLTIEMAGDAFAFGRLVAQFRPNLIFLDQRLPGVDALDLVSRLARDPETLALSIVVMAPVLNSDLERAFRSRGALACVKRPPAADAIDRLVRTAFHIGSDGIPVADVGPSILVVDGDSRFAKSIRREIEERVPGCRVATYETCIDALIAIGADRPDVMILDVGLSDLDCVEMIRRVHARTQAKPVTIIAVAGQEREALRTQLAAAGAKDFLVKPLTADRLLPYFASREPARLAEGTGAIGAVTVRRRKK